MPERWEHTAVGSATLHCCGDADNSGTHNTDAVEDEGRRADAVASLLQVQLHEQGAGKAPGDDTGYKAHDKPGDA